MLAETAWTPWNNAGALNFCVKVFAEVVQKRVLWLGEETRGHRLSKKNGVSSPRARHRWSWCSNEQGKGYLFRKSSSLVGAILDMLVVIGC